MAVEHDDYYILGNIRQENKLEGIKKQFNEEKLRYKLKDSTRGTIIYIHHEDFAKGHSILIDMRLDEVDGADLSIDNG